MKIKLTDKEVDVAVDFLQDMEESSSFWDKKSYKEALKDILEMSIIIIKAVKDGSNTIEIDKELAQRIGEQFAFYWLINTDDANLSYNDDLATLAYKLCYKSGIKPRYYDDLYTLYQYIGECQAEDDDFCRLMGL